VLFKLILSQKRESDAGSDARCQDVDGAGRCGGAGGAGHGTEGREVSTALWSYARLGRMPARETWEALAAAAKRVVAEMKPQEVSNLAWAHSVFEDANKAMDAFAVQKAAGRG
jgi:hypothetical protein